MSNQDKARQLVQHQLNQLTSRKFCLEKKVNSYDLPDNIHDSKNERIKDHLLDQVEDDIQFNQKLLEVLG